MMAKPYGYATPPIVSRQSSYMVAYSLLLFCLGLKKKLQAVSRSRSCGLIEKWIPSIINHFYFSVRIAAARATTAEERGELAVAIWVSMLNHVQNKHCGHSEQYGNCEHGDLLPRKWIFSGTFSCCVVTFHLCQWISFHILLEE